MRSYIVPALALFILPLVPILHIFQPYHEIFSDHYLYISVAAAGFVVSFALYDYIYRKRPSRRLVYSIFAIPVALAIMTVARVDEWATSKEFWSKIVEMHPKNARAHVGLGVVYGEKGMYDEAITEFKKSIAIDPNYTDAYLNLGVVYLKNKEHDKALTSFQRTIELDPLLFGPHINLFLFFDQLVEQSHLTIPGSESAGANAVLSWLSLEKFLPIGIIHE